MNRYRSALGTRKAISVAPSGKALTWAIVCSRASSMSITLPGIMTDSERQPLRLISRGNYAPASDSFHIGRGWGLTETDEFSNLRHLFSKGVPCVRDAAGLQPECVSPVLRMSCSDRKRS